MVYFIVESIYSNTIEVAGITDIAKAAKKVEMEENKITTNKLDVSDLNREQWILYVNGASNENGSGASMMLISPEEHKIDCVLRFGFQASIMRQSMKY